MRPKRDRVTMEQYMDFLENPHSPDLTVTHLNQIIAMHGFNKLHRRPKMDLVDTLNMMDLDLVCPYRSTLKDSISSSPPLTKNDVIDDLNSLQWTECSLQTIQTVNSVEDTAKTGKRMAEAVTGIGVVKTRTGKRKTRKRRSLTALSSSPPESSTITAITSTNSSHCWS